MIVRGQRFSIQSNILVWPHTLKTMLGDDGMMKIHIFFLIHVTMNRDKHIHCIYIVRAAHIRCAKSGEISRIGHWNAMDTGMAHAQHLKCFYCVGNSITFELATSAASSSLHMTTYIVHCTEQNNIFLGNQQLVIMKRNANNYVLVRSKKKLNCN